MSQRERVSPYPDTKSRAEEQRNKRKLVDRKRRETTRKCVDQLVDLVGGFELGDKQPNVTSVLAATVRFIEETQKELQRAHVNGSAGSDMEDPDDGSGSWSVNMLFEQSADLFLLVDTRGAVLHAAPSIADILGYRPDTVVGTPLQRLVPPVDAHIFVTRLGSRRPQRFDVTFIHASGQHIPMSVYARTATNPADGSRYVIISGRADPMKFGLEARLIPYSATHSDIMITHHAADGIFVKASRNASELFGLNTADILGKSPYVFYHPEDIPRIIASHSRVVHDSEAKVVYRFLDKAANHHVWVETRSQLIFDDATGQPVAILCKTMRCSPLAVSVLHSTPASMPAIDTLSSSQVSPDLLRSLMATLNEENKVLRSIIDAELQKAERSPRAPEARSPFAPAPAPAPTPTPTAGSNGNTKPGSFSIESLIG